VRQVVIPSIKENFAVGGRPPWAPLEASTVQQKRGNTQPLVRTGKLRRNMGYMSIWHIDAEKAFIADLPPRIWYGKVHQAGATFSSHSKAFKAVHISYLGRPLGRPDKASSGGVIPARPFVVVQPEDVQAIEEVFERWLEERIVKAGLR
jgi:phage gpG-like protein